MGKLKASQRPRRNWDELCDRMHEAFRTGKLPEVPVIRYGSQGFFLGDEGNQEGISVSSPLDKSEGEAFDPDDPGLLPEYGEVLDHIYEDVKAASADEKEAHTRWDEAISAIELEGRFSALLDATLASSGRPGRMRGGLAADSGIKSIREG